ncbi:DUF4402 domain-containing protein [Vibrio sp. STUT-A11]|uniref:DUF4402 domain-containing protein n=1 Tax=Vibrio sp. STUT-A11 TaxID=2976236 RepID=UPI00222E3B53|nr:DUF4402 domain-containing protein [Vibrio sp. STUT-A11]BDR12078.1 hypothetical protein VspSTUT11_00540 [Vibrio sp. STUT-A11]
MKNNKKLAYAALAVFASSAYAEGVAPEFNGKGTASVEVKNTLDIVETASLNFGTIAAVAGDDATLATLKLDPASGELTATSVTATDVAKKVGSITPIDKTNVSPGTFTVSNAARYTDLNIALPKDTETIELKMENAAPESLKFTLGKFTAYANDKAVGLDDTTGAGKARTDENGNLVLLVGATLSTEKARSAGTEPYLDAEYKGEYAVTISY